MLKKMDSDSEIEVYYPEEEASNETTPINCDEVRQDGHLNKIQDFIYSLRPDNTKHSYYKELVRKPGKLQRNKQISKDLCWKVHDPAQSFVLCSHPLAELGNRHVSIG